MRMSVLIRSVAISHVVPVMHMFIEGLRDPQRHRFHDGEQPIQDPQFKEWIVDQVMRNTVDIPGHAYGINQAHTHQYPPGRVGKYEEES